MFPEKIQLQAALELFLTCSKPICSPTGGGSGKFSNVMPLCIYVVFFLFKLKQKKNIFQISGNTPVEKRLFYFILLQIKSVLRFKQIRIE